MADMLATSSDYQAMVEYWELNAALMGGVAAVRAKGRKYLPQFPNESDASYNHRLKNSRFTNVYRDIIESLASKPFTKEVGLANADGAPEQLLAMVEDIDRGGNHLHVFAQELFLNGIANAIDWFMVDHTKTPPGATLADERRMGSRPFWVRIPAMDMLAVYSEMVDGVEQFVYARIRESRVVRSGHEEATEVRVRVLIRDQLVDDAGAIVGYGPARYEVWKPVESTATKDTGWEIEDAGPITIGVIPLVPFWTGQRITGGWRINPPMRDVADLQIEHYQEETNLKSAKEVTAFPMLSANGIAPPSDASPAPLGPSTILYAPPDEQGRHGSWSWVEMQGTSLSFLSSEIDRLEGKMRELGRQPLVAGTAGITQIAAALGSQKASSAIQAWAFLLKDALEKGFVYTAMWLGIDFEAEVYVNTDFAIELGADKAPETLLQLWDKQGLSLRTLRDEYKRRGILSPEFSNDDEDDRLANEMPGDPTEQEQRAALGV